MKSIHNSTMLSARTVFVLTFSALFFSTLVGQNGKAQHYILPMDLPLDLSGNFMEPRSNHFHSGIDIRTGGQEGVPVKAVADGWVSRIKISPWGYGKAVYIDHGNGHTSVYGHLKELLGPVAEACLKAQYQAKDFSIDIYPDKNTINVKQGEVFALSGNTGGSGGPHLHFEIRRTGDQHALDPEQYGFAAKDRTPPQIRGIRIYPLNDSSRTAPYPGTALGIAAHGGNGKYTLGAQEPIAYGTVGLAIHTVDRYDNSNYKFGVRKIELIVDSAPVFSSHFNEVDFNTNRYCNAHMDHALYRDKNMDYHRCYRLPHNKLNIYGKEKAQGRIVLEPGSAKQVRFLVTDANGNRSELEFTLKGASLEEALQWPKDTIEGSLFRYDTQNVLHEEDVHFELPPMSLYDDAFVRYETLPQPPDAIAPLHVLHDALTPLHASGTLRIKIPELEEKFRDKALIVNVNDKGNSSGIGGEWKEGWIEAKVRSFGKYTVMLDTVPPKIDNVDLRKNMQGRDRFNLKVQDDLSGVHRFTGKLDGEWILLEYEPKLKMLTHIFDVNSEGAGDRKFELEVFDERGNRSVYSLTFSR